MNYKKGRRARVFGGPNGSGKTTILEQIDRNYDIGYYINADKIESEILKTGQLDLENYGLSSQDSKGFQRKIKNHSLYTKAIKDGYTLDLKIEGTKVINPDSKTHSYEAALIADLIRSALMRNGKKFSFETVMSHHSKIDFLKDCAKNGYKNYLYYISTESPIINIERVKQRVKLGGHPVSEKKIKERYFRSLDLLSAAITNCYRSFIFDNSGKNPLLIMEVYQGKEIVFKHNLIPSWVSKYIINKLT